jgi:hypothetical protein
MAENWTPQVGDKVRIRLDVDMSSDGRKMQAWQTERAVGEVKHVGKRHEYRFEVWFGDYDYNRFSCDELEPATPPVEQVGETDELTRLREEVARLTAENTQLTARIKQLKSRKDLDAGYIDHLESGSSGYTPCSASEA